MAGWLGDLEQRVADEDVETQGTTPPARAVRAGWTALAATPALVCALAGGRGL